MPTRRGPTPRRRRQLTYVGVGVAAVLGVAALFIFGPSKSAPPDVISTLPAQVPAPQIPAPISAEAKRIAVQFVETAVARKNLAQAWNLVGPNLRGGLTRKEWLTGNNPVVPYPISVLDVAPFKVDQSFKDSALLEVALIPKQGSGIKSQDFYLGLVKVGHGTSARWVVDNWVPRSSALLPRN